jgi:hypothetical protein
MKLTYRNILVTALIIIAALFLYILQVVTIQRVNSMLTIIGIITILLGISIIIWEVSVLPKKYSKLTIVGMLCPAISGILGGSAMLLYGVMGPSSLHKYYKILSFDPIMIIAIGIMAFTIVSPIIIVIGRVIEKKKTNNDNTI